MKLIILLLAILLSFTVSANSQVQYEIIDLGSLGGSYSAAKDINDAGMIIGHSSGSTFIYHAFLYENGIMTDLGSRYDDRSTAWAINNSGQIAIESGVGSNSNGYLYDNGEWTSLSTTKNQPWGMNNSGQIVGVIEVGFQHAYVYENSLMTDLGSLYDNRSVAFSINDSGQIVGVTGSDANSGERGFLFDNGVWTDLGVGSRANSINYSGQIVGEYNEQASLYDNGIWTDLGTLDGYIKSFANDINDSGQIIGTSYNTYSNIDGHAALYDNGIWTDLGTLGGNYSYGQAINNSSQIVGWSETSIGEIHAVLWNPVTVVPEPISSILFITGIATLGLGRLRLKNLVDYFN